MNQVLTIVANPRSNSFTRRLLQSFLTAYKQHNLLLRKSVTEVTVCSNSH
jgi:FMN-dependent NADH-azoreductase